MTYPIGYGEAEHRRALDALLADLATHGKARPAASAIEGSGAPSRPESPAQRAARILGATSATGHCHVELRMHPLMGSKA
jgi:hypothetical protein